MFESFKLRIKPISNALELDQFESQVFQSLNDRIESDFQLLDFITHQLFLARKSTNQNVINLIEYSSFTQLEYLEYPFYPTAMDTKNSLSDYLDKMVNILISKNFQLENVENSKVRILKKIIAHNAQRIRNTRIEQLKIRLAEHVKNHTPFEYAALRQQSLQSLNISYKQGTESWNALPLVQSNLEENINLYNETSHTFYFNVLTFKKDNPTYELTPIESISHSLTYLTLNACMVLIEPALQTYYAEIEKQINDSVESRVIRNNLKQEDINKIFLNIVNYLKSIYSIELSIEQAVGITSAASKNWNIKDIIKTAYQLPESAKILKEIAPDAEYLIDHLMPEAIYMKFINNHKWSTTQTYSELVSAFTSFIDEESKDVSFFW